METEFPEIGCQYELSKIVDDIVSMWMDKSMSKPQKLEKLADKFIEYKTLVGLTKEELQTEIHSLSEITVDDIVDAIMEHKKYE